MRVCPIEYDFAYTFFQFAKFVTVVEDEVLNNKFVDYVLYSFRIETLNFYYPTDVC